MQNRLLRYFYSKNTNIGYTRDVVLKNFKACTNLLECFNTCKMELM